MRVGRRGRSAGGEALRQRVVAVAVLFALAGPPARAQMPDPSAMSGIPRPDGTVPAGKLVVRVIRGDFAHPMVGTEVVLDGPGGKKTGTVGADGRASFEGLGAGGSEPYTVSATAGSETVSSQSIALPADVGVKVMLVFKADGSAPPPPSSASSSAAGAATGPATTDASGLSISRKSHLILEIKDEGVEVIENLFIQNSGAGPVDPGAEGLVFPLAEGAQGAQVIGEATAGFTVAGSRAILKGPIRTGETAMSFGQVLPLSGGVVELRQRLPVKLEQLVVISGDLPGMEVGGVAGLTTTPRELGGRKFLIINGPPVEAGGELHLTLSGLPHRSRTTAYLAVLAAALVLLWGLWAAFGPTASQPTDERVRLEAERKALLDELSALERNKAGTAKAEAKHTRRAADLTDKLEQVMRELDDFAD